MRSAGALWRCCAAEKAGGVGQWLWSEIDEASGRFPILCCSDLTSVLAVWLVARSPKGLHSLQGSIACASLHHASSTFILLCCHVTPIPACHCPGLERSHPSLSCHVTCVATRKSPVCNWPVRVLSQGLTKPPHSSGSAHQSAEWSQKI